MDSSSHLSKYRENIAKWRMNPKSSSSLKLMEFHSKLISKTIKIDSNSSPSGRSFRNPIKQTSPLRNEKPKLGHYSSISNFVSKSPITCISPLRKNIILNGTGNFNRSPIPTPVSSKPSILMSIIPIEDLRKSIEAFNEMDISDINSIPYSYSIELQDFCKLIDKKFK